MLATMFSFRALPLIFCVALTHRASCLHLSGTWNGNDFFIFLARFGFQQTIQHDLPEITQGYIYGNVTSAVGSDQNATRRLMFVVVDSEYFLYYFGNRSHRTRNESCATMFKKIDTIAWDEDCNKNAKEDFLRRIPCRKDAICDEETAPASVIKGYQFTYSVQNTIQPRFWYVSMVSCHRDSKMCDWSYRRENITVDYDIWLVNGHPDERHTNPLEHQFSFEMHGIVQLYIAFAIAYTLLLPVQLYALSIQRHPLPLLLTVCMVLEYVGVNLNFIHFAKFAYDGSGVESFHVSGKFIDMAAQCCFMLLLLLIVKGWTITVRYLSCLTKLILFPVWLAYSAANVALFAWNQIEVDTISDIDEWQTRPGWLILAFRMFIMLWFLLELRSTFLMERDKKKTTFYLHFGAGFLVWFVYLPLVAVICTQVSSLWRYKTILCVSYAADFLSFCVMVHLLWPTRTYLFFNIDHFESRVNLDGIDYPGLDSLIQSDLDIDASSADVMPTASTFGQELFDSDTPAKNASNELSQ